MPVFRARPSSNLTGSIRRLLASGGGQISQLQELQADSMAADTAQKMGLAEKARAEVEAMRSAEAARTNPAVATEYASHSSGMDIPTGTRLSNHLRGVLEQPSVADMDDAAAIGNEAQPYVTGAPNVSDPQRRLFQSSLASTIANRLATGKTSADQLAHAGDRINETALTNEAASTADAPSANRIIAAVAGKLREPFKLGSDGQLLNEETGDLDETTALARAAAALTGAKTGTEGARTTELQTQADLNRAKTGNERTGGGRQAPAGFRWGPAGADGQPTLVKIPGGPADDKATSSDAERIAAGYASRMEASAKIMGELELKGVGKPEFDEAALAAVGSKVGSNTVMSSERQKYRQAQEDWVRAKLRKESGAVIADEEMDREIRVYFPQIGDKQPVLAQKADARRVAERAMKQAAGRAGPKGGAEATPVDQVEARKMIGNVEFVKVGGKWFTP